VGSYSRIWDTTYQVADHDLAFTNHAGALGISGLSGIARRPCALLDAARRGGCRSAVGSAASRAAAGPSSLALVGEDLVQGLVKLARHVFGWVVDDDLWKVA